MYLSFKGVLSCINNRSCKEHDTMQILVPHRHRVPNEYLQNWLQYNGQSEYNIILGQIFSSHMWK